MGVYGSMCALGTTVRQDGYDAQVSSIQVHILWSSESKSKGAKHFLLVAWGTYDHLFCASTSETHGGRWFHTALLRQNFLTLWLLSYMHIACLMVGSICFCCVYYTNSPYTDKKLSGTLAKTTHRRGSNCTELPASPTLCSPKGLGAARQTWVRSKPCCPLPGAWVAGSWNRSCQTQETMAKDKLVCTAARPMETNWSSSSKTGNPLLNSTWRKKGFGKDTFDVQYCYFPIFSSWQHWVNWDPVGTRFAWRNCGMCLVRQVHQIARVFGYTCQPHVRWNLSQPWYQDIKICLMWRLCNTTCSPTVKQDFWCVVV